MNSLTEVLNFIKSTDPKRRHVFEYTGKEQKVKLRPGIYSFECWGASGARITSSIPGGKGAYVFGKIRIDIPRTFYFYVGQAGREYTNTPTFGGGGIADYHGGGASDIRLIGSNNFISKLSRIIVAAGGGGSDNDDRGGSGGGLNGKSDAHGYSKGATQTTPGTGLHYGKFGVGGGKRTASDNNGGGGGGYYGGGSGRDVSSYAGSGGSSFISGHKGCNAIYGSSTENSIKHTGKPFHYSGFVFYDTFMIDGDSLMPGIKTETQTGNNGNGHIRIIKFSKDFIYELTCGHKKCASHAMLFTSIILPLLC